MTHALAQNRHPGVRWGGGAEPRPRTGEDDDPALEPPSPAPLRVGGHYPS